MKRRMLLGLFLPLAMMPASAAEERVEEAPEIGVARLLLTLPEDLNTPDGCTLDSDGNVILSIPNFNNGALVKAGVIKTESSARMVRISPDNELTTWYEFADEDLHPETRKVGPMDCAFGPDGNLYLADNQFFNDPARKSRLLRINCEDGKALSCDVVAEGLVVSNAVVWNGETVYVSDTVFEAAEGDKGLISGVYAIGMDEWADGPVQLRAYDAAAPDPHVVAVYESSGKIGFGADGLAFDGEGAMYCGVFEDGAIYRTTFDADGAPSEPELFAQDPAMKSCDGIVWRAADNTIYVADSLINAVQAVDMDGNVRTVHSNGDTDGSDGLLDQPCEVVVRGNELVVINMDMWWECDLLTNSGVDTPYHLSVITLD